MKTEYRVQNGRKAAGVPKNFSPEERQKRAERCRAMHGKAVAARWKEWNAIKRKRQELKAKIKAAAEAGVFVPVQEWE